MRSGHRRAHLTIWRLLAVLLPLLLLAAVGLRQNLQDGAMPVQISGVSP